MRLINVTTKKELVAALAKRYARGKREENRVSSISSFRSGSRPLVEERQMHPAPDSKSPHRSTVRSIRGMHKRLGFLENHHDMPQPPMHSWHAQRVVLTYRHRAFPGFPNFTRNVLARLSQHEFCQKIDLLLLFIDERLQLDRAYLIEFVMQRHDFDLRFQVNLVVMCGIYPILGRMSVLAHHDHRRLNSCKHG